MIRAKNGDWRLNPRAKKDLKSLNEQLNDINLAKSEAISAYKEAANAWKLNSTIHKATILNIVEIQEKSDTTAAALPLKIESTDGEITDVLSGLVDSGALKIPNFAKGAIKDYLSKNREQINHVADEVINNKVSEFERNLKAGKQEAAQ
tara:strand:- start:352 stop:798 length:447 start_codon:yes stop_codon:yes gene_type:complete